MLLENQEVKVHNEEYILTQTTEKLQTVYKELKEGILSLATDIEIKPKAKYIAYVRNKFITILHFY